MTVIFKSKPTAGPVSQKAAPKAQGASSWLKRGDAREAAFKREKVLAEQRKEERDKARRFWMKEEETTTITFLDGNLDEHGLIDCPVWLEHFVFMGGQAGNYCCVSETEPCPICAMKNQYASLVGGLTVIDHSIYTAPRAGTIYRDQVKLFVAKQITLEQLRQNAEVIGGLAGATFQVSRSKSKSARVGDTFIHLETNSMADLKAKYANATTLIEPLDYSHEVGYKTAEELRAFGFGSHVIGQELPLSETASKLEAEL